MNDKPWYENGLRFECTQCGKCCTGAPGYVWVNKSEIAAMANEIGETDLDAFAAKYVRKVGVRRSLKEDENSDWDCVFFDNQKRICRVYNARPRQCRSWPFWDSNVRTEEHWERTCEFCPGSGQGKLHSVTKIDEQRNSIRV